MKYRSSNYRGYSFEKIAQNALMQGMELVSKGRLKQKELNSYTGSGSRPKSPADTAPPKYNTSVSQAQYWTPQMRPPAAYDPIRQLPRSATAGARIQGLSSSPSNRPRPKGPGVLARTQDALFNNSGRTVINRPKSNRPAAPGQGIPGTTMSGVVSNPQSNVSLLGRAGAYYESLKDKTNIGNVNAGQFAENYARHQAKNYVKNTAKRIVEKGLGAIPGAGAIAGVVGDGLVRGPESALRFATGTDIDLSQPMSLSGTIDDLFKATAAVAAAPETGGASLAGGAGSIVRSARRAAHAARNPGLVKAQSQDAMIRDRRNVYNRTNDSGMPVNPRRLIDLNAQRERFVLGPGNKLPKQMLMGDARNNYIEDVNQEYNRLLYGQGAGTGIRAADAYAAEMYGDSGWPMYVDNFQKTHSTHPKYFQELRDQGLMDRAKQYKSVMDNAWLARQQSNYNKARERERAAYEQYLEQQRNYERNTANRNVANAMSWGRAPY